MAAYYGQTVGRASLSGGSRLEQLSLPNGACGYRDLSAGVKAPTCGCRRFWLNSSHVVNQESERAWCFCGHHACFHDNILPAGHSQSVIATNAFPSSHQANGSSQPGGFVPPTWSSLIGDHDNGNTGGEAAGPVGTRPNTGLGIRNTSQPQPESINTRLWHALNGFAREQEDRSNSGDTSKLPSTAVPSVYDEPTRPSPSRALQEHMQHNRPMGPPVNIPTGTNENRVEEYSATEVATPSIRGTPDFRALGVPVTHTGTSPGRPAATSSGANAAHDTTAGQDHAQAPRVSEPTPPPTVSMGPSLSIQEMCNTIQNYGRRLSVLEGVSFQHMPSGEVQDRFDLHEGRLLDLEQWRTDQDQTQAVDDTDERIEGVNTRLDDLEAWRSEQDRSKTSQESDEPAQPSGTGMRHILPETSSFASDGSFDENAAAQTEAVVLATLAASAETGPRIDALESRISSLENMALPSYTRPWHIQVVLLPFGRQLPGIWFSASESTQHSLRSGTQVSEEWSGPQPTLKSSFRSTASSGAWTTESIEEWAKQTEDEWLSPKACGPSGTVFQRLASRGLVRDVALQAPDAHHITVAISRAFGHVLSDNPSGSTGPADRYHGLQERFIPLRKVRKSSRLRFLCPAEMITSATWTAEFLESSVFMKVNDGERRLYLTTSSAYTQPARLGWSWPALKDLPAHDIDGEVQAAQIDGNIVEACWTYNDRLDRSSSLNSSFASSNEASAWGIASEDNAQGDAGNEDAAMLSPSATRQSHVRSASVPSSAIEVETAPKRRVASFELEPTADTFEYSPEYIAKRRRISTSPELERRGVNFTPRWSREPPSPYLTEDIGHTRSSQATNRPRGTTPFAYATPHSHFDSRGDGDTEVDDVIVPDAQSDDGEYPGEWEGVQDGTETEVWHKEAGSRQEVANEDDIDEDNLEDGLTIYEA